MTITSKHWYNLLSCKWYIYDNMSICISFRFQNMKSNEFNLLFLRILANICFCRVTLIVFPFSFVFAILLFFVIDEVPHPTLTHYLIKVQTEMWQQHKVNIFNRTSFTHELIKRDTRTHLIFHKSNIIPSLIYLYVRYFCETFSLSKHSFFALPSNRK